ncbi:hypothetical protein BU26DRAFT_337358 [Trematosphaeria pertusa]|uniref:Uncharacterized protein n=1 Tax=Trematosphaeria pertusa TaxID=390896 RepID=A0A6A6IF65_9PLEO|nr:uncharacterized protein BU26DRAFT_337358 [Trematosphaeria pertusa]KAF2248542.1 hypothetical protein BU26DRAFT_337358 [Trematosphaeria pertusa]
MVKMKSKFGALPMCWSGMRSRVVHIGAEVDPSARIDVETPLWSDNFLFRPRNTRMEPVR